MDINKQPGIKVNGIILVSEKFSREPDISSDLKTTVDFDINLNKIENTDKFNVILTTSVKGMSEEKEVFNLECTFVGLFNYINGEENMEMDDFAKHNAPAIMFPYIREHISSITQKSGIKPIYLAPINVVALLSEKESAS
ncbi:protein-export chaperone SecB [Lutispora sp.]|uniref:protein-export chaperone SecB n=1 Tax=Lutispora sp. TaxID=2828727 RepID=UPI003561A991